MLKYSEQNKKIKHTIIQSIILHFVLIFMFTWSPFDQKQEMNLDNEGTPMNTMIVNLNDAKRQYNYHQQKDDGELTHDNHIQLFKKKDLQQKQKLLQPNLKTLKTQYLSAQEIVKTQHLHHVKQQKQVLKENKKTVKKDKQSIVQAKIKELVMTKQQINTKAHNDAFNTNKQVKVNIKTKTDQLVKKAYITNNKVTTIVDQSGTVDDLLGGLINDKKVPKLSYLSSDDISSKQGSIVDSEMNRYLTQVRLAISNKFYDVSDYSGKVCILYIKLSPDGTLTSARPDSGDPGLCKIAVSAAKMANIPRPPSIQMYEIVKDITLEFKP